ncbi:MAG: heme-binding protein [Mycobacterium sp.]
MTVTSRTSSPLRRGLCGLVAGGLLGVVTSAVIALPVANADPAPQCDTTVGQSVDSYLNRHPDVKQELTKKGQAESPGSPSPVLDYLNRHPDVRQHLITLSQQCAP